MKFGKQNSNYKHGNNCSDKIHYCIIEGCQNIVSLAGNKCRNCYYKSRIKSKNYCCRECGNLIWRNSALYGTGRCNNCKNKGNLNGRFNKIVSKETRKKISRANKGKIRTEEFRKQTSKRMNNQVISDKTKLKMSLAQRGKKHWNYIDGRSKEKYPNYFTSSLKEQIKKRDNYQCQNCNMTQEEHYIVYGRDIETHHIDYNRENCNKNNLITLCKQCNIRANHNRDYWIKYYIKLVTKQ